MPRTLAVQGGDVNVPDDPLPTACGVSALIVALRTKEFTVRSSFRRFHFGYGRVQICLTGRRGGSEPPTRRLRALSVCRRTEGGRARRRRGPPRTRRRPRPRRRR